MFVRDNGIIHKVIAMQGTKKVDISDYIMHSIVALALNQDNYPLLIHCNQGRHRTGCAVAVIRHVAGWSIDHILEEYRGFAAPKVRDCDVSYITNYQVTSLENLFDKDVHRQQKVVGLGSVRNRAKMMRMIVFAAAILAIWCFIFLHH
jgi:tyrosine-protein phosphatase SIW14